MPSKSAKQHRAMEAAKHGHSTLGIPQSVGQEYADADEYESKQPKTRKALPGRARQDKHPPIKRGETFTQDNLIGNWSAR